MITVICPKCAIRYAPAQGHECVKPKLADERMEREEKLFAGRKPEKVFAEVAAGRGIADREAAFKKGGDCPTCGRPLPKSPRAGYMRELMRKRRAMKS